MSVPFEGLGGVSEAVAESPKALASLQLRIANAQLLGYVRKRYIHMQGGRMTRYSVKGDV